MKLRSQTMKLCYVLPDDNVLRPHPTALMEQEWYNKWLQNMVQANPDVNFFLVVDTTDVFEEEAPEIDYNTVVYMSDADGVINHTFNLRCPAGCYGQWDECVYKKHPHLAEQDVAYLRETLPKE